MTQSVNLDGDDDNVGRFETVFVPEAIAGDLLTNARPDIVLSNNVATATFFTTPGTDLDDSFYVVVASTLSVRIEGADVVLDHGYLLSQPMVLDATGTKAFKPSCVAGSIASTSDWIDAPPPGSASVGVWTFKKHTGALVGLNAGLRLKVSTGQDPTLNCPDASLDVVVGFPWAYDATNWWAGYRATFDPATPGDLTAFVGTVATSGPLFQDPIVNNGFQVTSETFQFGAYFLFLRLQAVAPSGSPS